MKRLITGIAGLLDANFFRCLLEKNIYSFQEKQGIS